ADAVDVEFRMRREGNVWWQRPVEVPSALIGEGVGIDSSRMKRLGETEQPAVPQNDIDIGLVLVMRWYAWRSGSVVEVDHPASGRFLLALGGVDEPRRDRDVTIRKDVLDDERVPVKPMFQSDAMVVELAFRHPEQGSVEVPWNVPFDSRRRPRPLSAGRLL